MKFSIRHKITKAAIVTIEYEKGQNKWRLAIEAALKIKADLRYADLRSADLGYVNLSSADLSYVNLSSANLHYADLHSANLSSADLSSADLSYVNLSSADLRSADLRSADLSYVNLSSADLRSANLRYADLRSANLRSADLRSADLDFSSGIPFWCGSFGVKLNLRIAAQLAYHFCRIDFGDCEEAKSAQLALKDLANKFHRLKECGKIK